MAKVKISGLSQGGVGKTVLSEIQSVNSDLNRRILTAIISKDDNPLINGREGS